MESKIGSIGTPFVARKEMVQSASDLRFDWIMVVVSVWWLGGLFIDGWAHSNIPQLETFFTPWHAVFYSGYLAVAITLLVMIIKNLQQSVATNGATPSLMALVQDGLRGASWLRAIPTGYELSLLGLLIFAISGVGDLIWHVAFGIEHSTEALLSPTHLGLALGVGLAVSGPFRAAWHRSTATSSWRHLGPAILSLTFTFSLLTFFTEYAYPLIAPWALSLAPRSATMGITAIIVQTGLTMSFVLLALRRWRLPFGAFTFILALNGVLMISFSPKAIVIALPTALLGGLAADLLYQRLQPSEKNLTSVRLFAFLVPALFYLLYFIDLAIVGPIVYNSSILWSVHFWAGAPVIAGAIGCLLSYVVLPAAKPVQQEE